MDHQVMDFNYSKCLQEMTNWGEAVITNICSGSVTHVPWGTIDYIGWCLAGGTCFIAFTIGALGLAAVIRAVIDV